MRIKFNRGPMARKIQDAPNEYAMDFIIKEPLPFNWRDINASGYLEEQLKFREGSYHRSNVVLKNGTVVFEWMGWRNGDKAV